MNTIILLKYLYMISSEEKIEELEKDILNYKCKLEKFIKY